MPNSEQFLTGFNIYKGMEIGNCVLTNISISEVNVVRWNKYKYPIELTFELIDKSSNNQFERFFHSLISDIKVIRTSSNRPYICQVVLKNKYKEQNILVLELEGYAKRVSEKVASEI